MAMVWLKPQDTASAFQACWLSRLPPSNTNSTGQGRSLSPQSGPCPSCPPSAAPSSCQL
ncbi:hypothetical protein F751_4686 [Auxenochlorella protothecoides]|uniref:Uncharacterized protein n=1 Tax=Auxenochlorella protothecoides TaxID=3075 RepID=A0A087SKD9_AUXPR|nr:hypothetical protein F751_4686 [Auxenochlorella protothecoides]KFM26193.1 hypothetical protein F751_4686 [Auxenochlorella protothecoides]